MLSHGFSLELLVFLGLAAVGTCAAPAANAADIAIGVSSGKPVHQYAGRSVCRVIHEAIGGVTREVRLIEQGDAPGPLAVLRDVGNGAIEMGIVPSDWVHYVYAGSGPARFLDAKFETLGTLFSLPNAGDGLE